MDIIRGNAFLAAEPANPLTLCANGATKPENQCSKSDILWQGWARGLCSQCRETSLHTFAAAGETLLFGPCSKWEVNLTERLTDALRYISNNLYAWTDKLIKNSLFWLITDYMF